MRAFFGLGILLPLAACAMLADGPNEAELGALIMRGELSPEETELRELTDSALMKLRAMSDAEFAELELYPDFDE